MTLATEEQVEPKPFLKWAGGKSKLIDQYKFFLPVDFKYYHEPFLGGGALFFEARSNLALPPENFFLSDLNEHLINAYAVVRDDVENLINRLTVHSESHCENYYYKIREHAPITNLESAARFIYLNKTCFNGLYRENKSGKFNVPIGRYKNPKICDAAGLRSASRVLQGVTISCKPFENILKHAIGPEDFAYFDPPYHPVNDAGSFTSYTSSGFKVKNQVDLRDIARELYDRGVQFAISNSDCEFIRDLYNCPEFELHPIQAKRSINSKGGDRGVVGELLIVSSSRNTAGQLSFIPANADLTAKLSAHPVDKISQAGKVKKKQGSSGRQIAIEPRFTKVEKQLVRHFGSKAKLSKWIIKNFPAHAVFHDAMCGGASLPLFKSSVEKEVLNDLNPEMINLLRVVKKCPERLIQAMESAPTTKEGLVALFNSAPQDPIERAYQSLCMAWGTFHGCGGRWMTGTSEARLKRFREIDWSFLLSVSSRLQGYFITQNDALVSAGHHDSQSTLHYFDPPYLKEVRGSRDNRHVDGAPRMQYAFDMMDVEAHETLIEGLGKLQGAVVLSGINCPTYERLLKGWERRDRPSRNNARKEYVESLWFKPALQTCIF